MRTALAAAIVALPLLAGCANTVETDTFSMRLEDGVKRAQARDGELVRLTAGGATLTVRPLKLPPYTGNVSGVLPVYATNHEPSPPRNEGRTRINDAPGYELEYSNGSQTYLTHGEHARDGVVLDLRGRAAKALRLTLRSFEFGDGGD